VGYSAAIRDVKSIVSIDVGTHNAVISVFWIVGIFVFLAISLLSLFFYNRYQRFK